MEQESEKYPEFDRKLVFQNGHFQIGGHFEFENVKFGFLDLKNPRKVLLHKTIGSGKRNVPKKYSQYDI